MYRLSLALLALLLLSPFARAQSGLTPVDQRLEAAVRSPDVTVVHLWAPWCSNCKSELSSGGWARFLADNPKVHVIFVTVWNPADGRDTLERYGIGTQPNLELLLYPNNSRKKGEKVTALLGLPVSWIPTTWVFKDGQLRYALNYGELRFPILQQMVADSTSDW